MTKNELEAKNEAHRLKKEIKLLKLEVSHKANRINYLVTAYKKASKYIKELVKENEGLHEYTRKLNKND